ncbi:hypothetical protein Bbelb_256720 [Branchiostoma belcheri]|nr:hypothetical protein Bbelb_256720 [Branchiostoma belcheri]
MGEAITTTRSDGQGLELFDICTIEFSYYPGELQLLNSAVLSPAFLPKFIPRSPEEDLDLVRLPQQLLTSARLSGQYHRHVTDSQRRAGATQQLTDEDIRTT